MNLARVLRMDFGERWLADYLSEHETEIQLIPLRKQSFDKESLLHLFRDFLDYRYGVGQVEVVENYLEKSVSVPLMYELSQSGLEGIENASEMVLVPPQMVPPGKGAVAAVVKDWLINEALIGAGDVVIITEADRKPNGKTILAFVNDKFVIRRCIQKGRKVTLTSLVEGYEPIETTSKGFLFMAEIIGLIRFYVRS